MSAVLLEDPSQAAVTIDSNATPIVELNGGESSLSIDQSGTNVFLGGGGSGGSSGLTWVAPQALSSWVVPHNLGRHPIVSIRDSHDAVIEADVQHLDANTLLITFSQPVLGSVDLA